MGAWGRLQPRQPLVGVALAAVAGIGVAECIRAPLPVLFTVWAVALAAALLRRRTGECLAAILLTFALLHGLRHQWAPGRALMRELGDAPWPARLSGVVCTEPVEPRPGRSVVRLQVRADRLQLEHQAAPWTGVQVAVCWSGPAPRYGDRVELRGELRALDPARNPGEFDLAGHLQRHGVFCELRSRFAGDCVVKSHGEGGWLWARAIEARAWARIRLQRDLEDAPEAAAVLENMVLGLGGSPGDEILGWFQTTGTLHLFAVSGLQVLMLAVLCAHVLRLLRVPRAAAAVLTIGTLAAYALLTGLSASCLRATLMAAVVLLGLLFDRPSLVANNLAGSAVLLLAADTNQLFAPGFQFSYALVLALMTLCSPLQRWILPWGLPDPFLPRSLWTAVQCARAAGWRAVAGALAAAAAGWCGSLPFSMGYFHLVAPAGLMANILVVPLGFGLLAVGLASLTLGVWVPVAGLWLNSTAWALAKMLLAVVHACAEIPGGHFYVDPSGPWRTRAAEVTVLDVGSGGAVHVRIAGRDWLVDCGNPARYQHVVAPYLRARGVNKIRGLLLTHGDGEHVGAAPTLFGDWPPEQVFGGGVPDRSPAGRAWRAAAHGRAWQVREMVRGDVVDLGAGAFLRVLYPPAGFQHAMADDRALVLVLEAKGVRILLMSDSGFLTERWLAENEPGLQVDVVAKGHHRSDAGDDAAFLTRVRAKAVVIGRRGFGIGAAADARLAEELRARGVAVFLQEEAGAVGVRLAEDGWEVDAQLGDQGFRNRAR